MYDMLLWLHSPRDTNTWSMICCSWQKLFVWCETLSSAGLIDEFSCTFDDSISCENPMLVPPTSLWPSFSSSNRWPTFWAGPGLLNGVELWIFSLLKPPLSSSVSWKRHGFLLLSFVFKAAASKGWPWEMSMFDAYDGSLKEGDGCPSCSDLDTEKGGRREVYFEVWVWLYSAFIRGVCICIHPKDSESVFGLRLWMLSWEVTPLEESPKDCFRFAYCSTWVEGWSESPLFR